MIYGSVCSGIEAASVAWHPLGWRASFLSEIEAFPRAVLSHHYPEVPLHGDFTTIRAGEYEPIDLLVGGTPCQSFSVAGLRGGLDDDRGNLALEYLRLAQRLRPRWLVWENVPGVFSSASHVAPDHRPPDIDLDAGDGPADGEEVVVEDSYDADESHAFSCILAGFSELGYGFAYRVLDAQYVGVAQRRRRVFVVGHLGDWRRAAAVLFERHSLSGHPAPRRKARKDLALTISARPTGGGGLGTDFDLDGGLVQAFGGNRTSGPIDVASALSALSAHGGPHGRMDFASETFVTHAIQAGALRENPTSGPDGLGVQENCAYTLEARAEVQAVAFDTTQITSAANYSSPKPGDPCHPLASGAHAPVVAFTCSGQANSFAWERDFAPTLNAQVPNDTSNIQQGVRIGSAVRRLTPRECERLQGFPDDYTLIPYRKGLAADGPRYKALGNSMAVPVMRWIGERIAQVDAIPQTLIERSAA